MGNPPVGVPSTAGWVAYGQWGKLPGWPKAPGGHPSAPRCWLRWMRRFRPSSRSRSTRTSFFMDGPARPLEGFADGSRKGEVESRVAGRLQAQTGSTWACGSTPKAFHRTRMTFYNEPLDEQPRRPKVGIPNLPLAVTPNAGNGCHPAALRRRAGWGFRSEAIVGTYVGPLASGESGLTEVRRTGSRLRPISTSVPRERLRRHHGDGQPLCGRSND